MTIYKEFKQAIRCGIGRAFYIIKENPEIDFSNEIINASLYSQAYDTQSEGDRSWYLWELINISLQKEYIISRLLNVLKNNKEENIELNQLFSLAVFFVKDNNKLAYKIIYERYKTSLEHGCIWCGEDAVIEINTLHGISVVAEMYGRAYMEDSDGWNSSYAIEECRINNDELSIEQILEEKAKNNSYIQIYIKAKKEEDKQKLLREKTQVYTYDIIKERIDKDFIITPYMCNNLTSNDIKSFADLLLQQKTLKAKAKYLKIFRRIKFPYEYTILLDILKSRKDNKHTLKEYAIEALSLFKEEKIREYALEKLNTTNRPDYYTPLLINNYKSGDEILLEQIIKRIYNEDRIHNLISDYLEIFENNPTVKCQNIFEYFYNKMNCGIHRFDVVSLLYKNKVLSNKIQNEMQYDSDEDTRNMFNEIFKVKY